MDVALFIDIAVILLAVCVAAVVLRTRRKDARMRRLRKKSLDEIADGVVVEDATMDELDQEAVERREVKMPTGKFVVKLDVVTAHTSESLEDIEGRKL
jgi:hypothetical protein